MRLSETIPVPKMRRVQASDPIEDQDEKFSLAVLHSSRFPSLGWSHRLGRKFSGILSIFGTIFAVERGGGITLISRQGALGGIIFLPEQKCTAALSALRPLGGNFGSRVLSQRDCER